MFPYFLFIEFGMIPATTKKNNKYLIALHDGRLEVYSTKSSRIEPHVHSTEISFIINIGQVYTINALTCSIKDF